VLNTSVAFIPVSFDALAAEQVATTRVRVLSVLQITHSSLWRTLSQGSLIAFLLLPDIDI